MRIVIVLCALLVNFQTAKADALVVSAAASMKDALVTIAKSYKKHSRDTIQFNFASSGTLQRQIENGAPVDLFISAATKNMDELQAQGLVVASTRRDLARNRLVLIVPKSAHSAIRSFRDLTKTQVKRVAIGAPQSVPAGRYAQQVLSHIGIWKQVERKAVRSKDVREVLTQVEQGNVEAGIVYRTDAAISRKVREVAIAPESFHAPIRYPLAVVSSSRHQSAARKFAAFLMGKDAQQILRRYKFQ